MTAFTESAEYVNATYTQVHAINLGLALLNRAPADGAELNTWVATAVGNNFVPLARMILDSPEYAALPKTKLVLADDLVVAPLAEEPVPIDTALLATEL
jgi:hypothetical protein